MDNVESTHVNNLLVPPLFLPLSFLFSDVYYRHKLLYLTQGVLHSPEDHHLNTSLELYIGSVLAIRV